LWTLYAVNSYGDFQLSREAMDFLLVHQRADGKMMHEYSQTAELVDWVHLPYLYAAADSTPLFVMQMADYVRASGDVGYLREHWDNVKRAYAFTRAHTTNGVYDNSQGTGWVEEWLPKMPQQEIYLAALDEQSSDAMGQLAKLMGDQALVSEATQQAKTARDYLATYRNPDGFYSFSHSKDGSFDKQRTIFPAVAWWSGSLELPQADAMLDEWASPKFATDWGARSMAVGEETYDPLSYHHGSVWPLYTGWASLAQYRADRPQQGFASLEHNVQLTWLQDPGAVTEVLSGQFYQPLGRSSSHQLWSSAMVLSPAVRGLFGLEADALTGRLRVDPKLPAEWSEASVRNVPFGNTRLNLEMHRVGPNLEVEATAQAPVKLCLQNSKDFFREVSCHPTEALRHQLKILLPEVEVELSPQTPRPGDSTLQAKVIRQEYGAHMLRLRLDVPAGTTRLSLRTNGPVRRLSIEGAQREQDGLVINGDAGKDYAERTVEIRW
jgi:glycogen debranching enzyme